MAKVLVTGGCGYIGSHTVVDLLENGYDVISIDNLSNADPAALEGIKEITGKSIKNYEVDLIHLNEVFKVFEENPDIVGIIHFAALKAVGESVEQPLRYHRNNLFGMINILEAMHKFNVENLIFSSSCSVYGNAEELPVTEDTPLQRAESPYARTKQMCEHIIRDTLNQHKQLNATLLRYFNPAGAHESALIGEAPINKATSLVPVITETAIGKRDSMTVFGDDYDTRDGSCIRDYIHVMDLADAHTKALQYLLEKKQAQNVELFNLGIGEGVAVLEAIQAFEKVTNTKLNYSIGPRRPGDVVAIYANSSKARQALNWDIQRGIEVIMKTAWEWEKARTKNAVKTA